MGFKRFEANKDLSFKSNYGEVYCFKNGGVPITVKYRKLVDIRDGAGAVEWVAEDPTDWWKLDLLTKSNR